MVEHEHQFELVDGGGNVNLESSDSTVIAYINCTEYVQTPSTSVYGGRWKEEACDAMLTLRWVLDEVLVIDDGKERPTEDTRLIQDLREKLTLDGHEETFAAMADSLEVGDETVVVPTHEGTEYELVWKLEDAHVHG